MPGVVDQDVEAPEAGDRRPYDAGRLGGIREVGDQADRLRPGRGGELRGAFDDAVGGRDEGDPGTVLARAPLAQANPMPVALPAPVTRAITA